jgi:hypothetical protein
MRFKKPLLGVVVAALAGVLAMAGLALAANNNQTMEASISPNKLPKKQYKPAKISVDVATTNDDDPDGESCVATGTDCPAKTSMATIKFDKDLKFDSKAVKFCKENLAGTTTEAAKDACPKSVVGKGGATVYVPFLGVVDGVVTAFNGASKNKLILHSRVGDLASTVLLDGTLKDAAGKKFGRQLEVPVEQLPGGAVIAQFDTAVKKGKYVTARCSHKEWQFSSDWTYHDGDPVNGVADSQKCKKK